MNKIKAWSPIIVALIALVGCVWSAYYQSGKSDHHDAAVRALVEQLNDSIIPRVQESLSEIRERLAIIEAGCCKKTADAARERRVYAPQKIGLTKLDIPAP